MRLLDLLLECDAFEWDQGNIRKSWLTHKVSPLECEEAFFNKPLLVCHDEEHSKQEIRYYCLGKTDQQRCLFIVFTIRNQKIRVISARNMNRKEREIYNAAPQENPTL